MNPWIELLKDPNGQQSSKRAIAAVSLLAVLLSVAADAIRPGTVSDPNIYTLACITMAGISGACLDHFAPWRTP